MFMSKPVTALLTQVVEWARQRGDVRAVIVVGSHARGDATPDSDVDIGLLVTGQSIYVDNMDWVSVFGTVNSAEIEPYGRVISVRDRYRVGLEVEFSILPADWASIPVDPGTARVAGDGLSVLLDKDGAVSALESSLRLARFGAPGDASPGSTTVQITGGQVRTVRKFEFADWPEWRRMRAVLWPHHTAAEHEADMRVWLARPDATVIVCVRPSGTLCGFDEVGLRPYADGCRTSPVAFLEGWYVDLDCRHAGLGRALIEAVEAWACARGLRELASDTLLDNASSQRAHERLGFVEVERAVRYRKPITGPK
jgi:aminoglycoside 6'-N-acetyltransferase I